MVTYRIATYYTRTVLHRIVPCSIFSYCFLQICPSTKQKNLKNQRIIPPTDVIQLTLTLKMTTAQVVETSVTVNNNSPIQDYVHPDDQTQPFENYKIIVK